MYCYTQGSFLLGDQHYYIQYTAVQCCVLLYTQAQCGLHIHCVLLYIQYTAVQCCVLLYTQSYAVWSPEYNFRLLRVTEATSTPRRKGTKNSGMMLLWTLDKIPPIKQLSSWTLRWPVLATVLCKSLSTTRFFLFKGGKTAGRREVMATILEGVRAVAVHGDPGRSCSNFFDAAPSKHAGSMLPIHGVAGLRAVSVRETLLGRESCQ